MADNFAARPSLVLAPTRRRRAAIAFGPPVKDFANFADSDDAGRKRVVVDGIRLLLSHLVMKLK